jgi:TetR/AcrR family transcriptional repressor of nem operon
MARPRTFDSEHAVDAAMQALWQGGLGTTSVDALQSAIGIGRSSLYNAFGSKAELVRLAIDSYTQRTVDALDSAFAGSDLQHTVEQLLLDAATTNNDGRGCLLLNGLVELHEHDAQSLDAVREGLRSIAQLLVRKAEASGSPVRDPAAFAGKFIAAMAGARAVQRAALPDALARQVAREFAALVIAS